MDIPGHVDMLVVDGNIQTDRPPIVLLSKTKNIYAPTSLADVLNGYLPGAKIYVSDGSKEVELTQFCSSDIPPEWINYFLETLGYTGKVEEAVNFCVYTTFDTDLWGKVGRTYDLKIDFEGKVYTSSTEILPPHPLNKIYWKEEPAYPNYGYSYALLSDNPQQYDAYCWEVKRINKGQYGLPRDWFFKKVGIPFFDDQFFDGQTFEFYFENPLNSPQDSLTYPYRYLYEKGDTVVVKFSKVPRDAYKFMEHKFTHSVTSGTPFSTPSNVPSNIKGGALGVWIGYSPTFDTLYCLP